MYGGTLVCHLFRIWRSPVQTSKKIKNLLMIKWIYSVDSGLRSKYFRNCELLVDFINSCLTFRVTCLWQLSWGFCAQWSRNYYFLDLPLKRGWWNGVHVHAELRGTLVHYHIYLQTSKMYHPNLPWHVCLFIALLTSLEDQISFSTIQSSS